MAELKQIPNRHQLTQADPLLQKPPHIHSGFEISRKTVPSLTYSEYFHWKRLKHLNRS